MNTPIKQIDSFYRDIIRQEVDRICQNYVPDEDT